MSVAHTTLPMAPPRRRWIAGERMADGVIAFIIFISGFVMVEPAPYELALIAIIVGWSMFGLRLSRHLMPLLALLILFNVGGLLAVTQVTDVNYAVLYMAVTVFLAGSTVFYAAIISEAPERRFRVIKNAYVVSATLIALFGTVAYLELFPGAANFKLSGRAAGTFQDPNVFGPFLVLPAVALVRDLLANGLRRSLWQVLALIVISVGIFLSFSRAAWGLYIFTILTIAVITYCTRYNLFDRLRVIGYFTALGVTVVAALPVLVSIPAIGDLFVQRAQIVQYYDGERGGRFENMVTGFSSVPELPLGVGPGEFGEIHGDDEHNTYLKGLTAYGWIGGVAYLVLIVWTFAAAFPLLFKSRPWQPFLQATFAVFFGHLLVNAVIDTDHWRHLYLIFGLLWGAIAVEKSLAATRARQGGPATPRPAISAAKTAR